MEHLKRPKLCRLASVKSKKKYTEEQSPVILAKDSGIPYRFIENFFSKLQKRLKSKFELKGFVKNAFTESLNYSLHQFIEKILVIDDSLPISQLENVFNYLSKNELINGSIILKNFEKAKDSSDRSSESSDISSGSDERFAKETVNLEKVSETFQNLSVKIHSSKISPENFQRICEEQFTENVYPSDLIKFFLRKEIRIEDGPERNMLISYLLGDSEKIDIERLVQVFMERCFNNNIQEIKTFISEDKKTEFFEACKKLDIRKSGYLTWNKLNLAFKEFQIEPNLDLRYYCFCFENSLDLIPYSLL